MRSDVTLYVVAAFFFALTVTSAVIFQEAERSLWIVSTAVLGILSVGLGYYQRPKTKSSIQKMQTPTVEPAPTESIVQPATVEAETPIEQATVTEATPLITTPVIETTVETIAPVIETPAPPEESPAKTAQNETASTPEAALTNVKGIGEKRASQLNALGIKTVEELANASVEELAKSLKVSPKIVAKWVEAAKQQ
ncbi:MAG: helix-hairpin-helix domain-containing protein [Candidatus Bathyarchaeia archaeon]|jgi:predicted flap endonuclease-1-like 5' DNA nuclease